MRAKITLTKVHESYGDTARRYHQSDSELVAEEHNGSVVISIKQGARRSPDDAPKGMESTPESMGAIYLTRDEIRCLADFLHSLPRDD